MSRRTWILLILCFVGCTCETDREIVATSPDDVATIAAIEERKLGADAAGGHGFGCIWPTLENRDDELLEISEGPRAGEFRGSCLCREPDSELRVSADQRKVLTKCGADGDWNVAYTIEAEHKVYCLQSAFDDEPSFDDVPEFPHAAARIGFGGTPLRHALNEVETHYESRDVAVVLGGSVGSSGRAWGDYFERLPESEQALVREAARDALREPGPTVYLLQRALQLGVDDRAGLIEASLRLLASEDADNRVSGAVGDVLDALVPGGTEDLQELVCAVGEADQHECEAHCGAVFATTDVECDWPLDELVIAGACGAPSCDGALCELSELEAKLDAALRSPGAAESRAVFAQLVARRRWDDEAMEELGKRLARRNYEHVGADVRCNRGETYGPCNCGGETLRTRVCAAELAADDVSTVMCEIVVDDDARTITTHLDQPPPPTQADLSPSDATPVELPHIVPEPLKPETVGTAKRSDDGSLTLWVQGHHFVTLRSLDRRPCHTPTPLVVQDDDELFPSKTEWKQSWWRFEGDTEAYMQFLGSQMIGWVGDSEKGCWRRVRLARNRHPRFLEGPRRAESGNVVVGGHTFDVSVSPTRVTVRHGGEEVATLEPEEITARCAYFRAGAREDLVDFQVTFTDMEALTSATDCHDVNVQVEEAVVRLDMSTPPPRKVQPPRPSNGDDYQGMAFFGDGVLKWSGREDSDRTELTPNDEYARKCLATAEDDDIQLAPVFERSFVSANWSFVVDDEVVATATSERRRSEHRCNCLNCGE